MDTGNIWIWGSVRDLAAKSRNEHVCNRTNQKVLEDTTASSPRASGQTPSPQKPEPKPSISIPKP